jgi:hypothetical protein
VGVSLATGISVLLAALVLCSSSALAETMAPTANSKLIRIQNPSSGPDATPSRSPAPPMCETSGKKEITITCDYTVRPQSPPKNTNKPRIVLNRMALSFEANEESLMVVELVFANEGTTRMSDARTVYLAIDDDTGQNHVRRILPQIDFHKLAPGEQLTFSERLLIPAFRPGHYTIELWIPDPDPLLKFNPAHNFLISNVGVADPATGLNKLATFTVVH